MEEPGKSPDVPMIAILVIVILSSWKVFFKMLSDFFYGWVLSKLSFLKT